MSAALDAVEAIYFNAQTNLNDMLAACKSNTQRNQIMSKYVEARQNYWTCINKSFHEDDPALIDLEAKAKNSADELSKIDDQLGDIAKVINTLTTAVTAGAKIVGKIIAL